MPRPVTVPPADTALPFTLPDAAAAYLYGSAGALFYAPVKVILPPAPGRRRRTYQLAWIVPEARFAASKDWFALRTAAPAVADALAAAAAGHLTLAWLAAEAGDGITTADLLAEWQADAPAREAARALRTLM